MSESTIKGSCHCGAVQWEAPEPTKLARCNCSFCDRIGAEWAHCSPDEFRLITAPERLSAYQFGTFTGVHYHCPNCGSATHGTSPDYSTGTPDFDKPIVGYNVRMAHEFDRSGLPVEQHDGRNY
jgi:hypothetical protein